MINMLNKAYNQGATSLYTYDKWCQQHNVLICTFIYIGIFSCI